jgi:hypothetical protein
MGVQHTCQRFHTSHYIKSQFALRQRIPAPHCAIFHIAGVTMARYAFFLSLFLPLIFLAGCGKQVSVCPVGTGTPGYLSIPPEELLSPSAGPAPTPIAMKLGGRTISVDKVVEGPLCNDTWSGIVYVSCNVQVYPWVDQPTFLKGCNLSIAPGTVVYVAYHNDAAYYNGCSCHTGEIAGP